MPMISSRDLQPIGDERIDQEHRQWVELFSRLENEVLHPSNDSGDAQLQILQEILDFTRTHFAYEEELMAKHDYPDAARHRRMHKEFDQRVYDYYRQILSGDTVLTSEILKLIGNWFITHTSSVDSQTFIHINAMSRPGEDES